MLKSVVLIVMIILLVSSQAYAEVTATWRIEISGGQDSGCRLAKWKGYDRVVQNTEAKTITCTGKGTNKCEYVNLDKAFLDNNLNEWLLNDAIDFVIIQIEEGFTAGSDECTINVEKLSFYRKVLWAKDLETNISTITIYYTDEVP